MVKKAATDVDWDLLSSYAGLLSLAAFSIYAGAYGSLPRPKRAKGEKKPEAGPTEEEEEEDEEDEDNLDRMSSDDAWLFPIIGSVALVGLYTMVKYLGEKWINWLLGWYFSLAGVGSVWNSSISLTRYLVGETRWKKFDNIKMSVKKGTHVMASASVRTPSVVLLPLALTASGMYAFWGPSRKSVVLTDVLALSFAHNALSLLKIDSFKTGCILLSGLFVYDVWWVFGTDVVYGKVATTLDVPIKLLWPKSMLFAGERGYTMLGLGDVVIPGTFIALALRYDHARGKGKPPACILSFVVTAVVRGEMEEGWKWEDGPECGK
ncbi:signal peptide peptidase-domain-containing protein [Flammula alnicola]|nr:signal peptide peptidase-domain-containing protein [Flammula alnicola]